MNEIRENLEAAYSLLARLQASGEALDVVAAVRTALREALGALEKAQKERGE